MTIERIYWTYIILYVQPVTNLGPDKHRCLIIKSQQKTGGADEEINVRTNQDEHYEPATAASTTANVIDGAAIIIKGASFEAAGVKTFRCGWITKIQ